VPYSHKSSYATASIATETDPGNGVVGLEGFERIERMAGSFFSFPSSFFLLLLLLLEDLNLPQQR